MLLILPASSCRSTDRTIRLRVGADAHFRAKRDWERLIRRRVAAVSRMYGPEAGIRWRVSEIFAWSPVAADMDEQRVELKKAHDYAPNQIVLGISTRSAHNNLGSVVSFSDTGIVADFPDRTEEANIVGLAHQLAHFFGASHSADPQSALNAQPRSLRFDTQSAGIIRRMRSFDFGCGLETPDPATFRQLLAFFSPSSPAEAHLRWGLLLRADDRAPAAVSHFRKAVELAPTNANARFLLAASLKDVGQEDDAIREYSESVRLQPDYADAYEQLGILLAGHGELERGTTALRHAWALQPADERKVANLAIVLMRQPGQLRAAALLFRRALELRPDWLEMRSNLERAEEAQQQVSDSVRDDRAALVRDPGNIHVLVGLGTALLRQGNAAEAARVLRTAVRADSRNAAARSNLAVALYGLGLLREARAEVEQSRLLGLPVPSDFERALNRDK